MKHMELSPDIRTILEAAIQAPSADNTQPWSVRVHGEAIDLYHVPERDISPYDSGHRASLVAHGAFIENAFLAAANLGRNLIVELDDPTAANSWRVARMRIDGNMMCKESMRIMSEYIPRRVTNRKPYEAQPLSLEQKVELAQIADVEWGRIQILDYPQDQLANAVSRTEQISFQNRHVHEYLFKNIRWNDREVAGTRDGFSIRTFELPIPGRIIFKVAKSWGRLKLLNRFFGLASAIPQETSRLYAQSGAFIGIVGSASTPQDFVQVGRTMQRVWLAGSALGLSLQPIGAILFFKQAIDAHTTNAFSKEDREIINAASTTIADAFRVDHGKKVLFLFRAGLATMPSARTVRLQLSDIIRS